MKKIVTSMLRHMPFNKVIYPLVLAMWKKVQTPIRRRRLQKYGLDILSDVHAVMRELGIRYYVYWGTLLGIVRENGFIKHDDDIDMSIVNEGFAVKDLVEAFERRGFQFVHAIVADKSVLYYTFSSRGIHVDFFCEMGSPRPGVIYSPETRSLSGIAYVGFQSSWDLIELLDGGAGEERNFKGIKIVIPCNPEKVLESMYGASWRIPDPNCKSGRVFREMDTLADRLTDWKKVEEYCRG